MKPIEELRKEFESVKRISELMKAATLVFSDEYMAYKKREDNPLDCTAIEDYVNGAWFMFQELNK